jgi:transposase
LQTLKALRGKKHPGAAPKLTPEQFSSLTRLLEAGPEAHGFRGEVWTCPRVVEPVRQEFGVSYHPAHMSRILKRLGWPPQKPVRRATQRNEAAIDAWREEVWPELKKSRPGRPDHGLR